MTLKVGVATKAMYDRAREWLNNPDWTSIQITSSNDEFYKCLGAEAKGDALMTWSRSSVEQFVAYFDNAFEHLATLDDGPRDEDEADTDVYVQPEYDNEKVWYSRDEEQNG